MTSGNLSIIIPVKNESKTITKTIAKIKTRVKTPHEIIVIDGCSSDGTSEIVHKLSKTQKNVHLVSASRDKSDFSNSLKLGFDKSKNDFVLVLMGDLCDELKAVDKMFKKKDEGWDIVCGSRYIKGGKKIGGPKLQGCFSWAVCKSLRFLTGIPTSDVSNAFKLYRKSIVKQLKYPVGGVEASMYLTLQAYFKGAKITEIPTVWKGRTEGESKFNYSKRLPKYLKIYLWSIKNAWGLNETN